LLASVVCNTDAATIAETVDFRQWRHQISLALPSLTQANEIIFDDTRPSGTSTATDGSKAAAKPR
jgi:hypothetical protein